METSFRQINESPRWDLAHYFANFFKIFYLGGCDGGALGGVGTQIHQILGQQVHEQFHEQQQVAVSVFFGRSFAGHASTGVNSVRPDRVQGELVQPSGVRRSQKDQHVARAVAQKFQNQLDDQVVVVRRVQQFGQFRKHRLQ